MFPRPSSAPRWLLAGLLSLAAPSTALASGYYVSDIGARGVARGGAFVAAPNSLLALSYNPAGLSLLKGAHAQVDLVLVNFGMEFQRSCPCLLDVTVPFARENETRLTESLAGNLATDDTGVIPVPFIGIGYGFDWQNLTVAFGVFGPTSPKDIRFGALDFETTRNLTTRYSITEISLFEAYYALGTALEVLPGLRLGGSAMIYSFGTRQGTHLYANTAFADAQTAAENTDWDIPLSLDFRRDFALNFNFGLSYSPTFLPGLSIGASVLGKRSVRANGKATITIPDGFGGPLADSIQIDVQGDDIQLEVDLPPIWRAGIQYSVPAIFSAEVAMAHEAWMVHDQIVVRPQNINVGITGPTGELPSQPLNPITQVRNFQSTTAFRFGGELHLLEPFLGVAAGYYFEPSAVPDTHMDPSTPDWDKHAVSFGLNTTWLGLRLDVSVQHVFMASRTITNSQRTLVGPLEGGVATNDYLTRVGNGTYEGSYTLIGASLGASFDALLGL